MPKFPFMKFYVTDFWVDVMNLNLEERGAWITILCHIWLHSKNGKIDIAYDEIAPLFGGPETYRALDGLMRKGVTQIFLTKIEKAPHYKYEIYCKRIEADKAELHKNSERQSKYRNSSDGSSNATNDC